MSDTMPPSEFGGKTNDIGVQPLPHQLEAYEKLRAIYITGDPEATGLLSRQTEKPRPAFVGLLPEAEQRAIREAEGAFEKGQIWEEMQEGG